jgi:hypothetical protein
MSSYRGRERFDDCAMATPPGENSLITQPMLRFVLLEDLFLLLGASAWPADEDDE